MPTIKLSERIVNQEAELTLKKDQLVEATNNLEAAPDEESLLAEVEELTAEVEQKTATVAALKKAETALAARAKPIEASVVTADLMKRNSVKIEKGGDLIFKHATAQFIAHVSRQNVAEVIEKIYKEKPEVKETWDYMKKSQIDPAMTTVTGWAAELVQTDHQGFLSSLEATSIAAMLSTYATSVNFGGYGSVTIPMENPQAGTPTEPAWVSEGSPIPLTQFGFSSMVLNRYKLGAITTFTRELAERSTPAIEGLLREGLRKAYSRVLDNALLSTTAAIPNVRPAGLYMGVAPIGGAAGGGDDAVRADILAMLAAMTAANLGSKPVLIVNKMDALAASMMVSPLGEYSFKDELSGGSLLSIPVIVSNNMPQHEAALVDADALATAFDVPVFDVSDVASVIESSADNVAPTMASDSAGAPSNPDSGIVPPDGGIPLGAAGRPLGAADAGYKARSLWQTYSVGIRMVAPTSWGAMRSGAVQRVTGTTWS